MSSPVYFNKPQLRSYYIRAKEEIAVWGRGTGKSSGLIAPRIVSNVFTMPRSHGVMVADSFQSMLTKTLPGVIDGLSRLGYRMGEHFFFGQFAPAKWKWEKPYNAPLKAQYFMHWINGSGVSLISLDRPGSANGLSIDWLIGDEAKFLNRERYQQEVLPTMRGNLFRYGHRSEHHSILLTTDMPTNESGMWILDYDNISAKEENQKKIQQILDLQKTSWDIQQKIKAGHYTEGSAKRMAHTVARIDEAINQIRKGDHSTGVDPLIYFSTASSLDNIEILGAKYFEQMKRNLPWYIYKTSILNQRLDAVDHGFYHDLSEKAHGYVSHNTTYIDALGYDFSKYQGKDCRLDGDLISSMPLDMALDYGGSFNCLVVGQWHGDTYKFLNNLFVPHPKKLRDLAIEFKRYYAHHPTKVVNYFYDHTAKATSAMVDFKYFEEWRDLLSKNDEHGSWRVNMIDIGQTPTHHKRYEMWGAVLKDAHPRLSAFRYNTRNCEEWALSCKLTPLKQGRTGFEKDKSAERKKDYPQQKAPHLSDAGDTLLHGVIRQREYGSNPMMGITVFN